MSKELDKELNLCSYKVGCSSKSAQEMVQVSRGLVWHPASCSFPAIWAMYRSGEDWVGTNFIYSAGVLIAVAGGPPYDYVTYRAARKI